MVNSTVGTSNYMPLISSVSRHCSQLTVYRVTLRLYSARSRYLNNLVLDCTALESANVFMNSILIHLMFNKMTTLLLLLK